MSLLKFFVRCGVQFGRDRLGSVAFLFAMMLPILLVISASTIDYAMLIRQKAWLQAVVDKAAMAAAKELSLSDTKRENVPAVVAAVVGRMVEAHDAKYPQPALDVVVKTDPLGVEVNAKQTAQAVVGGIFGMDPGAISVRTVARVVGSPNICVLALNESSNGTLSLEQNAQVTGDNCAVYSNSRHNIGIKTKNSARLTATTICSAGGVQGGSTNFNPPPIVDCPQFEDPLASRSGPPVGSCEPTTLITADTVLSPGTYCGLEIRNGANVELIAGDYVILGAPLLVTDGATLRGKGVGLYFTGAGAKFDFEGSSTISLEAPTSGPLAGLLIFSDPSVDARNTIYSENAQVMVGTIYVPKGELRVDGAADVGSASAYTAIVAEKLRLYGGPHIRLNTNYDQTDVPVPNGIKGAGQPVRLVE